jgi:hypothetical protein
VNKPELGEAVVSMRPEVQYLEFSMSASVQGWRTKWFYIKDRKASSEDEYGLAPFDASKELKKLASWDSPPTDAEMEGIALLLTHIQALKGGKGGYSTHGVLCAMSSSTPAASPFQTLELFWLGGSFSHLWRSNGEAGSRDAS